MIEMDDYKKLAAGMEIFMKSPDFSVGTTPAEIIFCEDKIKLVHYIPTVQKQIQTPILIVYALVNRYYILDLQPDKSVIRKLLDEGFDVYVIDWGYPSGSDRYLTLDDYINGYLNNAVDKIRDISGMNKITLLGVCQGGTFSVIYSALYPEKVKNLATLVTPVDFDTDKGLLHTWAKSLDVDKIVDYYGIIPGDFLNAGFLLLDPLKLMVDKYVDLFDRIECREDPACELRNKEMINNFLRMEKWIFDSPDQAGETFRQFMKDCYQKNLLIKNEMVIGDKKINLKNINMPLLNIMAEYDHLVPNDTSKPLTDVVSSTDKQTYIFPTGHIGIFVGSKSQKEVCPKIAEWLKPRSVIETIVKEKDKIKGRDEEIKEIELIKVPEKEVVAEVKEEEEIKKKGAKILQNDRKLRLENKVVIITGAGSGIGKETAILFAKEGAKIVVTDVNEKAGEDVVSEIEKNGGSAFFASLDTSNREQSRQVVQETMEMYGKVDVLINNAGIISDALITNMTEEQWDKVINIDLKGPFNCIQAVIEAMEKHETGEIINVSSIVGLYGNIGQTNYSAAKAGLIGMTKTLAKELGRKGIRVNAVAPGFIHTPMTEKVPEKILDIMKEKTPLKRLGQPNDVGYALMYLASDEANFVNGAIINIDGGLLI